MGQGSAPEVAHEHGGGQAGTWSIGSQVSFAHVYLLQNCIQLTISLLFLKVQTCAQLCSAITIILYHALWKDIKP